MHYYNSDMNGAPQLTVRADLIGILKACLITGFGAVKADAVNEQVLTFNNGHKANEHAIYEFSNGTDSIKSHVRIINETRIEVKGDIVTLGSNITMTCTATGWTYNDKGTYHEFVNDVGTICVDTTNQKWWAIVEGTTGAQLNFQCGLAGKWSIVADSRNLFFKFPLSSGYRMTCHFAVTDGEAIFMTKNGSSNDLGAINGITYVGSTATNTTTPTSISNTLGVTSASPSNHVSLSPIYSGYSNKPIDHVRCFAGTAYDEGYDSDVFYYYGDIVVIILTLSNSRCIPVILGDQNEILST